LNSASRRIKKPRRTIKLGMEFLEEQIGKVKAGI